MSSTLNPRLNSPAPAATNDTPATEPRANRLLAALADEDLQNWLPLLRPTLLLRGQVLPAGQAFFPTTVTVSLFASTRAGDSTEVATVGSEGFVGVSLLSGIEPWREQAEVTSSGYAFALAGTTLRREFQRSGSTMELLLRYVQLHTAQTMQRAVCVHHHSIEQRLCRCLLDSLDRGRWRSTVELTHQSLAVRLGVRRETITTCAQRLQSQGIITYQRGVITVDDLAALRAISCCCYDEVRSIHDRLLPPTAPALHGDPATRPSWLAGSHLALVTNGGRPHEQHGSAHRATAGVEG